MIVTFETLKKHKTFAGETIFCRHESSSTRTSMAFSAFLPVDIKKIDSAIIWLSGLTCTEENFITKAGAQFFLQNTSTMIICPDTSPRRLDLPGEHDSYDFGSGAGFYLNARTEYFKDHYQMYDYITCDLIELLRNDFGINKFSISGHSMGGHGALVLGLKEPQIFSSISAFSPIVNPTQCPWGQKAFQGYLGDDKQLWKQYDACELLKTGKSSEAPLLVDQGLNDEFYPQQLLTENLEIVCKENGQAIDLSFHKGYDHSYYFISTFIEKHIRFHLNYLS
ncbi:MAG TPA: S-formylglutathione hydrolase [Gammaproteobacteria bacterium]|nr:S-formylglutathione hydrolase [Gammaproteobacteria bacterium]HPI95196.1 S-formylglutathione hydrolase [Gammaproteobacteria bacterium]